jgi:phytoene dehydrogenase-like protein
MAQTDYDAIIIGAGHNGLVTAAYLAKAGYKTLVLEQRAVIGGAAATEEIWAGFKVNTGAADAGLFHDKIVAELKLAQHGLKFIESPVTLFAPQPDGSTLTLWRDENKSVADIGKFSQHDANCYPDFARQVTHLAHIFHGMMQLTPPDLMEIGLGDMTSWGKVGLQLKRLGNREMMEFMRVLPMAVHEYLDEWFEHDAIKGAIGADGIVGSLQGPRGAGTSLMLLYQHSRGFMNGRSVSGGIGQLSAALASAAKGYGAEVKVETAVSRILLNDDEQAVGVALADGTVIRSRVVVSNADPRRTFFGLVGPTHLEPRFMKAVRNINYKGVTAKLNLELSGLPQFNGQTDNAQLGSQIRISPSLTYLEKAYDAGKYGRISQQPYLDCTIPTLTDPSLAPSGKHILSITMQYAPYHLRDGKWDKQREPLTDLIIDMLAAYAPNLPDLIQERQLLTPLDYEQTYSLTEGSIFHGQMGLDQLLVMRPIAGWSQYRTPIDNLYLCGAGTHPGGGVTGTPGMNAAREVIKAM